MRFGVAVVAAVALALPGAALSAAGATKYAGTTSQDKKIRLRVSANGEKVTIVKARLRARCESRSGETDTVTDDLEGLPKFNLREDGVFRKTLTQKEDGVTEKFKVRGVLENEAFTGRMRYRAWGPGGNCDTEKVMWSARLQP